MHYARDCYIMDISDAFRAGKELRARRETPADLAERERELSSPPSLVPLSNPLANSMSAGYLVLKGR